MTAATSSAFIVAVGPAAKLAFTQQPSSSTGGIAFPTQPTVTVQDAGGNTVTTDTSDVTLAITSGTGDPSAALPYPTHPLAATAGVARFDATKIHKATPAH